ncbi:MAG TPA: UDP-N-acetylglucosamine--N-acetylmuramyl-(pentapeptide) pyrophosphoryl-undecaprenol N-acetylglucosamine transferase [Candidatus Babeliales bacterium]|nr:UDP-N-acetylglucosamine--N-acetylmuramyl-(pentapeptide) pyrophosphoryl-undecaprenol N-acetylglucosamine transferase [Candidatus Babeliales bacterium]
MEKKEKVVAFVAGCSGGHITPAITLAQTQYRKYKSIFFTRNHPLDKSILEKKESSTIFLSLINIPRKNLLLYPKFLVQFFIAFAISFKTLLQHRPTSIISTGSYIALPVCFAGWLLRIPIELYEVNVEPGQAIKLLSYVASKINICFTATQKFFPGAVCKLTEYPVRFTNKDKKLKKNYSKHKFDPARKTLFVVGGSQGSVFLNDLTKQLILANAAIKTQWQVIHQTGNDNSINWKEWYKELGIPAITFSYYSDIADYYNIADLIITRAGAGTLAEISFFEKPCIIIPLSTNTTQHQKLNALALVQEKPKQFYICEQGKKTAAKVSQLLSVY